MSGELRDEVLLKILDRLDKIESRLEPSGAGPASQSRPAPDDSWGDWSEDPAVVEPLAAVPEPEPRRPAIPRFPTPAPKGNGFVPRSGDEVEWEPGMAKLPVSDVPVGEGVSSGHQIRGNANQLNVLWQREMIAPQRRRPAEG